MSKTVYMFPGQGAQYIGMGKDFYDNIPVCKKIFEVASDASGLDIPKLCFEENEQINITEYTQIAMLTVEAAIFEALEISGKKPQATAGLSLGEYGALIASKVMEPGEAFRVVRQRGIFMQEAVPTGGAMSAILGLDAAKIEEICEKTDGIVSIANYNCPGQIVITGEEAAVAKAAEGCKEAGAKRAVPLKVSGPFHSAMLRGAGEKLGKVLETAKVSEFAIPYVANVTADYVTDAADVKPLLTKQVSSPVRWQQTIERLIADGFDEFVEIGPGHTLSGFMRKINRDVKTVGIEKLEDLKAYVGE
ncbi:MAG: ACP S-malonyltransferase [Lachnospiraceae bacterium]|nr:ACP S-malonyltransferase [Lachnospiraceae bacterium]